MSRILKILQTATTIGGQRVCEACGSEFTCGASLAGCWCLEIQLTDEIRRELRSKYTDCLCRLCLETLIRGVAEPVSPGNTSGRRSDEGSIRQE